MKPPKSKWPQRNPVARRSGSSSVAFPPQGEFIIDSLSAINEYLRFSPQSLTNIVLPDVLPKDLLLGSIHGDTKRWTPAQWKDNYPDFREPAAIWASARVHSSDELEFLSSIKLQPSSLVVILDHITDPRNLGAIARTCGFFGVRELIVPRDRQVHLTSASVSTAQGAFSLVKLIEVVNLARTLESLKDQGYWIIGADMAGESPGAVAGFYEKTALVFGSEGSGLSNLIHKRCDRMVAIEGATTRLESLNVSVAAGILIREFASAKSHNSLSNNA